MDDKNCDVAHERELREQWQTNHEHRHDTEHKAVEMARDEMNRRLDEMNELRKQIEVERGTFLEREVYDKEYNALRDMVFLRFDTLRDQMDTRLKILENSKSNLEGRLWAIGAMISVIVIAVNLGLHYLGVK